MNNKAVDLTCNGWKNYQTWNVACWLLDDEFLREEAKQFAERGYNTFVNYMHNQGEDFAIGESSLLIYFQTPDKVAWNDSGLDIERLDQLLKDL